MSRVDSAILSTISCRAPTQFSTRVQEFSLSSVLGGSHEPSSHSWVAVLVFYAHLHVASYAPTALSSLLSQPFTCSRPYARTHFSLKSTPMPVPMPKLDAQHNITQVSILLVVPASELLQEHSRKHARESDHSHSAGQPKQHDSPNQSATSVLM